MFQAILAYLHSWANYGLALCKMAKNREIGWVTIDRKVLTYMPYICAFEKPEGKLG
jgi:hypothetical protein